MHISYLDLAQQVDEVLHAASPAVALHLLLHLPRQPPQRRRPLPQRLQIKMFVCQHLRS